VTEEAESAGGESIIKRLRARRRTYLYNPATGKVHTIQCRIRNNFGVVGAAIDWVQRGHARLIVRQGFSGIRRQLACAVNFPQEFSPGLSAW
jgi:hypothetical protein